MKTGQIIALCCIFTAMVAAQSASADTRFFVAQTTSNWSNTLSWSNNSGGAGGASVPTKTDIAIFDANGTGNCNMDIDIDVSGINVQTGYTGTISQRTFAIIVRTDGATFSDGVFHGGSGYITIVGDLTLSGNAQFTSSGGTMELVSNYSKATGALFNANGGSVKWSGSLNSTISGSTTFNNLEFSVINGTTAGTTTSSTSATYEISAGTELTVSGLLLYSGEWRVVVMKTGTIKAMGDFTITNTAPDTAGGGTATIHINGNADQTLTGSGQLGRGKLPNVTIDKQAGTLFLSDTISLGTNSGWTYLNGTIDGSTHNSTVVFTRTNTITGSHTLYNVTFEPILASTSFTISSGTQLTVAALLKLGDTFTLNIMTGEINALSDILVTNKGTAGIGGTATINITGTGDQTLTGSGTAGKGRLPGIHINKPSGTLFLSGIVTVGGNWKYSQGNIDMGSNPLVFAGHPAVPDFFVDGEGISSTMTFKDVVIFSNNRNVAGTLDIDGNLEINSGANLKLDTHQVFLSGNLINHGNTSPGKSTVTFNGSAQQTISGSGTSSFNNLVVNNSSGVVYHSPLSVSGDLNISGGAFTSVNSSNLRIEDNTTLTGISPSRFITGSITKIGNDSFLFPLGKGANYQPLSISAPANTTDAFTAEYFNAQQVFGDSLDTGLTAINSCEYWTLNRTAGTSEVAVTLGWNQNSCDIADSIQDMLVAGWDGTKWVNHGGDLFTGDSSSGAVSSKLIISKYSHFLTAKLQKKCTFPIAVNISANTTPCIKSCDGIATVTHGGTPPYTYKWSNGETNDTAYALCPGTFIVTVRDALGCRASATGAIISDTLLQPAQLAAFQQLTQETSDVFVCDTSMHRINFYNSACDTLRNTTVSVQLPFGVNYIPGSVAGNPYPIVDSNITDPNAPVFHIPVISDSGAISISYLVQGGCGAIIANTVSTIVSVNNPLFGVLTDTSGGYIIRSPVLSVSQTNISPVSYRGNVEDSICRIIKVKNTGNATLFSGFTLDERYRSSVELVSASPAIFNNDTAANSAVISVPGSLLPSYGLMPDSIYRISECLTISECTETDDGSNLGQSVINYSWECNNAVCQKDSVTANAFVPVDHFSQLRVSSSFTGEDVCYGNGNRTSAKITLSNTGKGPGFNVDFTLFGGLLMGMDTSAIVLTNASGSIIPDTFISYDASICRDSAVNRIAWKLGKVPPGAQYIINLNLVSCCPDTSGAPGGYNFSKGAEFFKNLGYIINYREQCDEDTVLQTPLTGSVLADASRAKVEFWGGPPDMDDSAFTTPYDGDTGIFKFRNVSMQRWSQDATSLLRATYLFNGGLCYLDSFNLDSSLVIYDEDSNKYWMPENISIDIDPVTCGGTVTAWFRFGNEDSNFRFIGSEHRIRLIAQCDAPPSSTIDLLLHHIPTNDPLCATGCAIPLDSVQGVTFVHCPGCARDGIDRLNATMLRKNYGLPDNNNDGIADVNGTLDQSKILISTVMTGDTIMGIVSGAVKKLQYPQPHPNGFQFGYYELKIPAKCDMNLTPVGATVRIKDSSTTDVYTIPDLPMIKIGGHYFVDYSIDKILAYLPPSYDRFDFEDSITIMPMLRVTGNPGAKTFLCTQVAHLMYLGIAPDPCCDAVNSCEPDTLLAGIVLSNGDTLPAGGGVILTSGDTVPQCDSTVRYFCEGSGSQFFMMGYGFSTAAGAGKTSCAHSVGASTNMAIGEQPGTNRFPYEYRNWGFADTISLTIPPGFAVDSISASSTRTGGFSENDNVTQFIRNIIPDSIFINGNGDTVLAFNIGQYYSTDSAFAFNNGSRFYFSDDDNSFGINAFFHPTCETEDTTVPLPAYVGYEPGFVPQSGLFALPKNIIFDYIAPELSIPDSITVDGVTRNACWKMQIGNRSQGIALNTWMTAFSPSGKLKLESISPSPERKGNVFLLGDLGAFGAVDVEACVSYNCKEPTDNDTLIILLGWNCPDYPATVAGYPCVPDSFVFILQPRTTGMQDSIVIDEMINICDTLDVEAYISSSNVANLYDITIAQTIPAGLSYIIQSGRLEYPAGTVVASNLTPVITGNILTWKIDSISAFLRDNGLPGSGFTDFPDSTELGIVYSLESGCKVLPHQATEFTVTGITNCKDTIILPVFRKTIEINGYPAPIQKTVDIKVEDFSFCDSTAAVDVFVFNTDTVETDSFDLFNFILPPCVKYDNDFTALHNAPDKQTPLIAGNLLTWQLPGNIVSGDSMTFSFAIKLTDSVCALSYEGNTSVADSLLCDTASFGYCYLDIPAGKDADANILPLPLSLTFSATNVSCNSGSNGSASASVSGGTTPYTYLWSNGGASAALSALAAGVYTVTVTDGNSCTATQSLTITQPSAVSIAPSQTNLACNGGNTGTATATASGGTGAFSYLWNTIPAQTTATATGLSALTYSVTVTDANSCAATQSFTITQPSVVSITKLQTNVSCNGGSNGSATATASGGTGSLSYSWNTTPAQTTATATGLSALTYSVTVTDANSCTATQSFTITQPSAVSITPSQTNVSCNGGSNGSATATASGGTGAFSYLWSNGGASASLSALAAGVYTVTVTDANSCTATQSFTITQPSVVSITPSQTNLACNGGSNGSATASVSGGTTPYTYLWNTIPAQATGTATGLTAGTYNVTVTDANSCTATATYTITEPPAPLIISAGHTDVSCFGGNDGTATIVPSGGATPYQFLWFQGSQTTATIIGLSPGNYSFAVLDNNGCVKTGNIEVNQPDNLVAGISKTDASCHPNAIGQGDGEATATVSGGVMAYSYLWSNGATTQTATQLGAGTYSVTVTDANGCSTQATASISSPDALTMNITTTAASCNLASDGSISVSVSGATAPYTIQYNACGSCATTANPATFTGLNGGTYSIIVYDANGCAFVQSNVVVAAPAPISIAFATTPQVSCTSPDGTATANPSGGTPPYTYLWSNGTTSASLSGLAKGTYNVTVTDNKLCVATASVAVDISLSMSLSVTQPCGSDKGAVTATVTGGTPPYTYELLNLTNGNVDITATTTGLSLGDYQLTVFDNTNCSATENITLTDNTTYDYPNGLVIATDTTWNGVHYKINKGIVVEPGVIFTIINSTLEFSDFGHTEIFADGGGLPLMGEKGILLRGNARLRLLGATMQGIQGCENMWDGIGVTGSTIPPTSNPLADPVHGYVQVTSSTIRDAHTGIQSGGSAMEFHQTFVTAHPGIINTHNSTFINNRRHIVTGSVHATPSPVPVTDRFSATQFLCTAPLKDQGKYGGEGTEIFIDMVKIKGTKIQSCEFKNTVSSFAINQRGTGIRSMTSVYTVESNCGAKDPVTCECLGTRTKFENLTYGIYADAEASVYPITVKQADFIENYRGIYQTNIYGSSFTRNKIDGLNLIATNDAYGIYLNGSAGTQLEENKFLVADTPAVPSPVPGGYGIILNNTGSGGYQIYNNTFHDIGVGIYPQGQPSLRSNEGLQIKCNDFTSNITSYHIAVPSGDIGDPQGLCSQNPQTDPDATRKPAGNTFTHECALTGGDMFTHGGTFFRYNHHSDAVTTPQCFTVASVDPNACDPSLTYSKSGSCPTNLVTSGCGGTDYPAIKHKVFRLKQIVLTADSSIREGDNDATFLMIQQGQPDGKVKDAMLAISPYVSDRLLIAFINKNHPYSPGAIKEVMLANSPLTDTVINALLNRKYPLPPGILKEIMAAQTGTSARAELEAELKYFETQRDIVVNDINRSYLSDTNIANPLDSVIAILEQEASAPMKTLLSSAYIANANYAKARQLVDSIGNLPGYTNYAAINNFMIDVGEAGVSYDTLLRDPALLQMIENIANDTLKYGYLSARAIMSMLFDTVYPEPIEPLPLPQQSAAKWSGSESGKPSHIKTDSIKEQPLSVPYIDIYPNPARDKIILEFYVEEDEGAILTLKLFNIMGKEILTEIVTGNSGIKEISLKNIESGVYYYRLIHGEAYLPRGKLVIIK